MTIASLLLALITAANGPGANSNANPTLLDFHADWCGPCQQMRPVVKQFVRNGYPVRSVDIDREADLKERYDVHEVPTFIVIDASGRELGRSKGFQPVSELQRFYLKAAAKIQPRQNSNAHVGSEDDDSGDRSTEGVRSDDEPPVKRASRRTEQADRPEDEADAQSEPMPVNPKGWESSVRIKVVGKNTVGFGSGTIIYSTPKESLILTCAHIFKLDGRVKSVPPSQFPREIKIDLFDGKLHGTNPAQMHYLETVEGEAVDYDMTLDVGLIRIHPGRRLPASRVAPAYWHPASQMRMLAVGCPEGQDATAWHTVIVNPKMPGSVIGSPSYEAIECLKAPKLGRSGGGLFTDNGYIAGVCNFAEPRGDHGLYATPKSIYRLLDRNQLASLYAPAARDGGTLLADADARGRSPVARLQSPTAEEGEPSGKLASSGQLMIPDPALLGIPEPVARTAGRKSRSESTSTTARKFAWTARPDELGRPKLQTDLSLDPAADQDHFGASGKAQANAEDVAEAGDAGTRSEAVAGSAPGTKPRWHAVRPGSVARNSESSVSQ
jgi:thiol-disulfide isomerase/thioredoxin